MTGRNPDLPILDELGAEFEALVRRRTRPKADGPPTRPGYGGSTAPAAVRRPRPAPTDIRRGVARRCRSVRASRSAAPRRGGSAGARRSSSSSSALSAASPSPR